MRRSDPGVIEIKKRIDEGNFKTPAKGFLLVFKWNI